MPIEANQDRKNNRLRVRVTAAAEAAVRGGHPWVFADSIRDQNRPGRLGELAIIYSRADRFLALGLFDPESPIRIRVLHRGQPETVDEQWWQTRFEQALARRAGLFDEQTTGFRLLNGESDGWPGLVLDRYGATLVVKLYTAVWLPRLQDIVPLLHGTGLLQETPGLPRDIQGPSSSLVPNSRRVVLRLSRNIQVTSRRDFNRTDGEILIGSPLDGPVSFLESGLWFEADVLRGQKTGFFLDQRENRRFVETLAEGRCVLNAFSFSGGFSLYAARGGAKSVTDLDLSSHALASAERNFALNRAVPSISCCRREGIQADAFDWLAANSSRRFDLMILDPPSFAKRESERVGALRAYGRLISLGVTHLSPGGILLACSCSAHVAAEEFFEAARRAVADSGRSFRELQTTGHAPDHSAGFDEAHYLKAIYLQLAGR
jgi:23S rRNA (cytosine1962-C5)-methyltransferase